MATSRMIPSRPAPWVNEPQHSRKLIKNADGTVVLRTETVEERQLNKESLMIHKHNLEMELVRAETNIQRIKDDIAEVASIIAEIEATE